MDWMRPGQKIGIAVCSPHRKITLPTGEQIIDTITVDWHRRRMALSFPTNVVTIEYFIDGLEIGDARTGVAYKCLQHDPKPTFLFFLDDDVLPDYDAVTKLYAHARWNPDHDIFAGVYCCKGQHPSDPLIYAGDGEGGFWDWALGDVLTSETHGISAVHMGLTLIRTSLFQRMLDAGVVNDKVPFFKTEEKQQWRVNGALRSRQGTEDIHFARLARQVGAKFLVDTSVLAGHIDKNLGIIYGLHPESPPVKRAKWLASTEEKKVVGRCECAVTKDRATQQDGFLEDGWKLVTPSFENESFTFARRDCFHCKGTGLVKEKKAIDLGAGGIKRSWPGYETFTLDIRPDSKPDYCQDTRQLNFPNDHWDMVASSHHLEHIGRWDQEQVWREMYRVLKPGGVVEHIVPSIEWAARKISEHEVDEHVLNVLYGAQEAHGYHREWNTHYFGYTRNIAKLLAEQAGFVDVVCEDWTDNPGLGYNLIIRARKPEEKSYAALEGDVTSIEKVEAASRRCFEQLTSRAEVPKEGCTV